MQKEENIGSDDSEDELDVFARQSRFLTLITPDKIKNILNSSYIGAGIVNHYQRNRKFSVSSEQDHITEIIVDKLLAISPEGWKIEHYKVIAKSIATIFQNESSGTYFEPPIPKSATNAVSIGAGGKIPDRFKNVRHNRNRLDGKTRSRSANRPPPAQVSKDEGNMHK